MRTKKYVIPLLAVGALLLGGVVPAASAGEEPKDPTETPVVVTTDEVEATELPPMPQETADYVTELQSALDQDTRYSVVEISEDRKEVTVWWYGDPSSELKNWVESAPSMLSVTVQRTKNEPGKMRAAAQQLVSEGVVGAAYVVPDASAIEVASDASARRDLGALSEQIGYPITNGDFEAPTPAATRQNDSDYHIGGSRIYAWGPFNGCTSGFAVENGTEEGIMFAAHCGGVGQFWVTMDSPVSIWNYGTTDSRHTAYDGAIMKSNFSQPYVWFGPYNTTTNVGAIGGVINPPLGADLCLSGSYSGAVCNNIVTHKGVIYNLGGDLTSVTGIVTQQSSGSPAAGNGDSGGPAYQLVSLSGGGTTRYAASIISAIPADSPATCNGVPGDSADGGRKCSPMVWSTQVVNIEAESGWSIQTTP